MSGQGTKEIGGSLGTRETGDCIVEIDSQSRQGTQRGTEDTKGSGRLTLEHSMQIKTVGVLGCGLMGSGIAQVSAAAGYKTIVREVDDIAFSTRGWAASGSSWTMAWQRER